MHRRVPLPRGWRHHTKAAIVQILALSHYAFTGMLARAANSRNRTTRLRTEIDRLDLELALLREELRIKDARMERVPPQRRPHYTPLERMAIMELRAARGWSARQAARRFHVSMTTLASWRARIDEDGPNALLQITEPVNKFPDLVRYSAWEIPQRAHFKQVGTSAARQKRYKIVIPPDPRYKGLRRAFLAVDPKDRTRV